MQFFSYWGHKSLMHTSNIPSADEKKMQPAQLVNGRDALGRRVIKRRIVSASTVFRYETGETEFGNATHPDFNWSRGAVWR